VPPFSHLIPCTPTKSNLYLANSLAAAVSEPDLHRLLTFHVPNHTPLFRSLGHTKGTVQVWVVCVWERASFYGEELLAPRPTPKLEDHCLSAVHDCLFSIFAATVQIGGCCSIHNLRTRTHLPWSIVALYILSHGILDVCIQSLFYLLRHLRWPVQLIWMWT
jgi:hypothetical protein